MLGASFPPFPFYPLALVALVPLLARWSRQPALPMLFRESYSAFLIFAAFSGYWVLFHADMLKALLLGLGILVLPLAMTLPVLGSSAVLRRFGLAAGLTSFVAMWLTLEFMWTHGPIRVPWLLLGHTQANATPFHQIADVTGVGGLSFWVLAVNGAVFGLAQARSLTLRFALVIAAIALVLAPVGYRGWRLSSPLPVHDSLRVAVAQPAMTAAAWAKIASADRVQVLADLSDRALTGTLASVEPASYRPELLVWPEGALPVFPEPRLQHMLYSRVDEWTSRRRIALLTGAVTRFDTAPALTVEPFLAQQKADTHPYYNSAILFDSRRGPQQYDMIRMVPVADHVPTPGILPGQSMGVTRTFGTGGLRTVFHASQTRFSTLLAFEALFGDHSRQMVQDGAEFLTLLVNTGWWGYPAAHNQYQALARLRAIETRRAIVVASVTGGSGLILPDGTRAGSLPWMEPQVITMSVPLHVSQSLYVRAGDVIYSIAAAATVVIFLVWGLVTLFLRRSPVPALVAPRKRRRAVPA
jgi:apolipoprotein N-acyltransferase